ncbi:unnamed protein product [Amaranthus hypochondriacus]
MFSIFSSIYGSNTTIVILLCIIDTIVRGSSVENSTGHHRQLSTDYYAKTCPQVEQLVGSVTSQLFKDSPAIAPATIRLFFHDCFVQGCDASILLSTKPGSKELAEKDAILNKDLSNEAFEGINKAKALVETKCQGVVSCADILTISTRDYVHLAGGPYYEVKKGRWDGKISKASLVSSNIPQNNATIDEILKLFASKGLSKEDFVVLSGAHTIGYSHCKYIKDRIYNYKGTPNIDPKLLRALKMYCPHHGGNEDVVVPFDVTTPYTFDHAYYANLEKNMGILVTDQLLYSDPRTKPIVQSLSKDKHKFFHAFAQAMEKMGTIHVKRGNKHGEKRIDCTSPL